GGGVLPAGSGGRGTAAQCLPGARPVRPGVPPCAASGPHHCGPRGGGGAIGEARSRGDPVSGAGSTARQSRGRGGEPRPLRACVSPRVGAEPWRWPSGLDLLDAVPDPPVGELLGVRVLVSRAVVAEPRGGRTRQDSPVRLQLIVLAGRVDLVAGQREGQLVLHVALEDRDVEAHPVVHGVVRQRIIARLRHAALDGDATVVRRMDLGIEDELAPRLEERFFAVQDLNPPQDYADLFATLFLHGILLWVCDGRVAVSPASTERGRPASSNDDTCRPGASAGASRAAPNGQLPLRIRHYRTT